VHQRSRQIELSRARAPLRRRVEVLPRWDGRGKYELITTKGELMLSEQLPRRRISGLTTALRCALAGLWPSRRSAPGRMPRSSSKAIVAAATHRYIHESLRGDDVVRCPSSGLSPRSSVPQAFDRLRSPPPATGSPPFFAATMPPVVLHGDPRTSRSCASDPADQISTCLPTGHAAIKDEREWIGRRRGERA
jgi:hypothetical protein